MGKPGPKPKAGERYESGRLKPQGIANDAGKPGASIRNVVAMALRKAVDPRMGSVLGVMHLEGKITVSEFAAGCEYAKLRGRYDRAVGIPGRVTLSPDYGTARSISNRESMSAEQVEAVKERHAAMFAFVASGMEGAWCVTDGRGGMRWVSPDGGEGPAQNAGRNNDRPA